MHGGCFLLIGTCFGCWGRVFWGGCRCFVCVFGLTTAGKLETGEGLPQRAQWDESYCHSV